MSTGIYSPTLEQPQAVSLSSLFNPTPKQREAYLKLLDPDVKYLLYGGARGGGKAESVDALVCTPLGFKRMGDIRIGDVVSCPDGSCSHVIAIHPQGSQPLYRVRFIDGASVLVTKDHLWLAHVVGRKSKTGRRHGIYTTEELISLLGKAKNGNSTTTPNILIPLTEPVQFTLPYKNKDYSRPVDPYVLGVLLGGGCLTQTTITFSSADEEIVNRVKKHHIVHKGATKYVYSIPDKGELKRLLDRLGVYYHRAETKFVPEVYKYAPIDVRYELIRGLFDTDGYADSRGHVEFATVSEILAKDVQWIIRSLGGKATISEKTGKYGDVICQKVYRLFINIASPELLFGLTRKKERATVKYNGGNGELQRRVVSIEYERDDVAQCITIRHPDGLYITDDFIVTHNSLFGRWWLVDFLVRMWKKTGQRRIRVGLFCEDYPALRDRQITKIKTEFPDWLGELKETQADGFNFFLGEDFGEGMIALRNLDQVSKYASSEFAALFIDELTMVQKETFDTLRGSMRWKGVPETKFLGTANPGGVGMAWVKRLWIDRDFPPEMKDISSKFAFVQSLPSDNNYLTEDYWSDLRSQPPQIQKAWVDGDWNVFIGMAFPAWSNDRHILKEPFEIPDYWPRYVGIDWGYSKPFAVVWRAVDTNTGRSYIYREAYQAGLTDREQARLIKELTGNEQIRYYFADYSMWTRRSAGELVTTTANEYSAEGVPLTQADKDRMNGKRKFDRLLGRLPDGEPGLMVFPDCKHIIRTIPTLVYDEHRPEDIDSDGEDHLYDAIRYSFTNELGRAKKPNNFNTTNPFEKLKWVK